MGAASRVVLTREAQGNAPWLARLAELGFAALDLPLLRYVDLEAPAVPGAWDWALLTSPQAVRRFVAWPGRPAGLKLGALGGGTAATLREAGLADDLGSAAVDGAELARDFLARARAPLRVLLPGAEKRLAEPGASLRAVGHEVLEVALYRTTVVPPGELPAAPWQGGDVVFFCSPSAVRAFAAAWSDRPACVAIGHTTASAAREAGFDPGVAATPDLEGMLRAAGLER